jgi:beta-lactam-binding protein with PASTA domain
MGKTPLTILYILGATIALLIFTFFGLGWYTNHGDFVVVPDIKGKSMYEAKKELNDFDLDYIISDSTYDESKPPLSVLDQQPRKGSKVKENRKIYLTLNASAPPSVKIPGIIDNSRRQAELILTSWGLKLGNLIYIPDMAKDAVLNIQVNGKIVKPGTIVPKGTKIDLVLGDGFGNQMAEVPPVTDMTVIEARAVLEAVHLNVGMLLADGKIEDTLAAYVYDQDPKFGQPGKLGPGNSVNLFIRQQNTGTQLP